MTVNEANLRGVILSVDDMDAQCAFYQQLFGPLKIRDGDKWAALEVGGTTLSFAGADEQTGQAMALSVKVDDIDVALDAALAAGGVLASAPAHGAHEIRASVTDPAGHLIVFYSALSPA
ncbi:VOC family protein [Specibacter sp. RAF43]|uniref:VOC family protein n=1 Tax=Specibacter sp. RAF43 TaxID=3233057 RepID=UPI003F96F7CE